MKKFLYGMVSRTCGRDTFVNVEPQGVRTGANAYLSAAGGSSSGSGGVAWGGDLFVLTLSATQIKFIESANDAVFEMRRVG